MKKVCKWLIIIFTLMMWIGIFYLVALPFALVANGFIGFVVVTCYWAYKYSYS